MARAFASGSPFCWICDLTDHQTDEIDGLVDALTALFPDGAVLHEPAFEGAEWAYVKECVDTGWVSTAGSYVSKFESMLAEVTGAQSVSSTVSGTAALHMCLLLAGVKLDEEVIVPTLTFAGTANAVAHCHAVPHLVDINAQDLGIDAVRLDAYLDDITSIRGGTCVNDLTGRPIRAVVCVHVFGHAADLDALVEVCDRHCLTLIEDAAESLGTYYNGIHTGNHGRLAALSFNGNKIVTTGGGGAVMTNDPELGRRARHLTTTAKLPHAWEYDHDQVGYNYRMPNINAALGCAQLERLEGYVERKRELAFSYAKKFANLPGIAVISEPPRSQSNYWLNAIILDQSLAVRREELLRRCHENNVLVRPAWNPMHRLKPFRDCPRMEVSVAEDLCERILNLPSSATLRLSELGD